MSLEELYQFTVRNPRFTLSRTREQIMRNLWIVAGQLQRWRIGGELWVDGSFLTEKIDPGDVDFVLVLPEGFVRGATPEQIAIIEWLCEDNKQPAKRALLCDAYSLYRVPAGDPDYADFVALDAYWKKQFGTSRDGKRKGIISVALPWEGRV